MANQIPINMNSIPKISVLMITYNQEKVVRRALDSLIAQKEYLYEICINDDCSTDNTYHILLDYNKKYPELVKPVKNEHNLGIFQNVEATWKRPIGNLITRLSGDDECGKGWFEQVYKFIAENNIDLDNDLFCIYGDYIQRNKDGAEVRYPNKLVSDTNAIKLKLRKLLYGRGACYSKKILDCFIPVSQGNSFNAELVQDCQLQFFPKRNYYIPFIANIYYAQIGISTRMKRTDYLVNVFEGYERFVKFVTEQGYVLDSKDLAFIEYMKAFRTGKKIKALVYYFLSIDFSLGISGLQLNRVVFVLKNRLLKL